MTIEQLDNASSAGPFRPFTIHLADGRSFPLPHPEFLSRSPTGRPVIVYAANDTFSLLDLLNHDRASAPEAGDEQRGRSGVGVGRQ